MSRISITQGEWCRFPICGQVSQPQGAKPEPQEEVCLQGKVQVTLAQPGQGRRLEGMLRFLENK
jgi:hypothetical protein